MNAASRSRFALIALALLSTAFSSTASADYPCDRPQLTRVDATACAKAAESITALRRYVFRTRMIYGLQMTDYVRAEWRAR